MTAQLLDSARADQPLVSAYRSPDGRQLITVIVNDNAVPTTVLLVLGGSRQRLGAGRTYITSAAADLAPGAPVSAGQPLRVAPRSVTTLVSELR